MLSDGNMTLELIKDKTNTSGIKNIGLEVSDIIETVKKLEENNVHIIDKAYLESNVKVATCKDPNGIELSFIEK